MPYNCSICMGPLFAAPGDSVVLPCGHCFHCDTCLAGAGNSCAICRKTYTQPQTIKLQLLSSVDPRIAELDTKILEKNAELAQKGGSITRYTREAEEFGRNAERLVGKEAELKDQIRDAKVAVKDAEKEKEEGKVKIDDAMKALHEKNKEWEGERKKITDEQIKASARIQAQAKEIITIGGRVKECSIDFCHQKRYIDAVKRASEKCPGENPIQTYTVKLITGEIEPSKNISLLDSR
ncbi:hypothetical protein ADUPG1_011543 [Aduncisulcus paluster]|uniref:RING-type domain-containing protein n=1 Tax=Aduncisulcus paluster TaxID=2918883 RepID=A0ABQ5JWB9_9EUKA|nr:hypothetical protein ADUPG1_011543 [Aduncisulcus paluster]|eukprot:gnl/Carplike_NY0171/475_a659_2916.p1 GENE.gnl/Carplike_NY0171/475_a659_2916~~gnl/Carplike_NY0171/475_a659_2916.p1  ORF type:complete len:237 (+),score=88.02 gnl/Carplike_NY0171/475_a659_2916:52-762(+)